MIPKSVGVTKDETESHAQSTLQHIPAALEKYSIQYLELVEV